MKLSPAERKLVLEHRRKLLFSAKRAARNVEIIKLRRAGMQLKDIAARFKLSAAAVGYVVWRYEAMRRAAGLSPEGLRGKNVRYPDKKY